MNTGRLYFFNFTTWRMMLLEPFFSTPDNEIFLCKNINDALQKGLDRNSTIFIFGTIEIPGINSFAEQHNMKINRVEDAFIRSVGLGSSFSRPYSLIIDSVGVHFDPASPSALENILQNKLFSDELIDRAKGVRKEITTKRMTKYNHLQHSEIIIDRSQHDKVILVTGQVEDDMSILLGAYGLNNSDLLRMVRENNPNAYIIYKPHPDVLSGNRKGHIPPEVIKHCTDDVQTNISIDSCIAASDEIHTLTSGAGFDALLRKKKVFTYGMPFYAGWGLTTDYRQCERRTRKLSLDELVAGVLICYPRYISPKTNQFCEIEQTLKELVEQQERYFTNRLYRYSLQTKGYLLPRIRRVLRKVMTRI